MTRFEEAVKDIKYIFEHGRAKPYEKALEDDGTKGTLREVILQGSKAIGAGYRVKKRLQNDFNIISLTKDMEIKRPFAPTIVFVDLRKTPEIPPYLVEMAKNQTNLKLLVVDVESRLKYEKGFSFPIHADYYLTGFEKDIDPAISRMTAELYLNVDYAVNEEGITFPDGHVVKPYFKTSLLIGFDRSRDILEGILSSVVRKFDPEVIVSREITGKPPEDDVRMYELAEPIAKRLGIESKMIKRNGDGYYVEEEFHGKRVLLLKDVVGDAATTVQLIDMLEEKKGDVKSCVVLLDRNEGAKEILAERRVELYSLTGLAMYEKLAAERKVILEAAKKQ